jgi:hypothetical protein
MGGKIGGGALLRSGFFVWRGSGEILVDPSDTVAVPHSRGAIPSWRATRVSPSTLLGVPGETLGPVCSSGY